MVRRHVLLQGHLCVAHPATVGAGEGLGLLHREGLTPVVQVWGEKWGGGEQERSESWTMLGQRGALERTTAEWS